MSNRRKTKERRLDQLTRSRKRGNFPKRVKAQAELQKIDQRRTRAELDALFEHQLQAAAATNSGAPVNYNAVSTPQEEETNGEDSG
jgi:hypothetical protein